MMVVYTIGLILFILYTLLIFQVQSNMVILVCFIVQVVLAFLLKVNIGKFVSNFYSIVPLLVFTVVFNVIFGGGLLRPLIRGVKIFVVWGATNILSQKIPTVILASSVANLLYPFKFLGIDLKEIALIITIAISFIPILGKELGEIKNSLKAKNFEFSFKNLITRPQIFIATYINTVFNRIDEIEKSLMAKAFE